MNLELLLILCAIWPFLSGFVIFLTLKMLYFDTKITSNLVYSKDGSMYLQLSEEDHEKIKRNPTITLKIQRL